MIISHSGKKYQLNAEKALEAGAMEEIFRKVGDRYRRTGEDADEYLLACDDRNAMNLVNVRTGICWTPFVIVKNRYMISEKEWLKLQGGTEWDGKFEQIL